MSLSQDLLDAIDGGEECRGRDSQISEWARQAEALERAQAEAWNAAIEWAAKVCDELEARGIKGSLDFPETTYAATPNDCAAAIRQGRKG